MIPISQPSLTSAEVDAATRALSSGFLTSGEEIEKFEHEFESIVNHHTCLAVNSGTSALITCLLALGIGKGDEVIIPAFTFGATANAVLLVGAVPVFADIDPQTYCICPDSVSERITQRTAALMPVHLFGHPAPMTELLKIAGGKGLAIVEDAAQAHAASIRDVACGAFGDAAAFSFHATKNMTTGEGGMAVFKDPEVAKKGALVRNQGMHSPYQFKLPGYNFRMTSMAAAIGRVQLNRLPQLTDQRRRNASLYDASIKNCSTPSVSKGARHVYHQYTLSCANRDLLLTRLQRSGIDARIYYPRPLSKFSIYRHDGYPLEGAIQAASTVLSVPVGPHVSEDDVAKIIEVIET